MRQENTGNLVISAAPCFWLMHALPPATSVLTKNKHPKLHLWLRESNNFGSPLWISQKWDYPQWQKQDCGSTPTRGPNEAYFRSNMLQNDKALWFH